MKAAFRQSGASRGVLGLLVRHVRHGMQSVRRRRRRATDTPADDDSGDTELPQAPARERRRAHPRRHSPLDALPDAVRLPDKPFTEDLDEMVKRRIDSRGRDLQPHALLHRQRQERGVAYESLKLFEPI